MERRHLAGLLTASFFVLSAGQALSGPPPPAGLTQDGEGETVDEVAVRFYAAEMGGPSRPRFIMQRMLAFEARIQAKVEDADARSYQDRHARAAMDHHIAEELLVALPLERAPGNVELARLAGELRAGVAERIGGEDALRQLAAAEGISEAEVAAMFRRRARAAVYIERAILPILYPTEEQLRDVYRTAAHPYKSQKFEEARAPFARWYVDERLRAAETAFLQAARSRVKIAVR